MLENNSDKQGVDIKEKCVTLLLFLVFPLLILILSALHSEEEDM